MLYLYPYFSKNLPGKMLAVINRAIVYLRWWLYHKKILPVYKINGKVISVGNLSLGGTGKTVMVEYLCNKLLTINKNVAIITRGYGRRDNQPRVMPPPKSWELVGDEPLLLAQNIPGAFLGIHKNRLSAILKLIENYPRKFLFILDDGFQYLKLHKDLNILLINGDQPLSRGQFFPAGNLRDGLWRLKEADIFVITRSISGKSYSGITSLIREYNPSAPLFQAQYQPLLWVSIEHQKSTALSDFEPKKIFAFSGIANPMRFHDSLRLLGLTIAGYRDYPDHYPYQKADLSLIEKDAHSAGAEAIITTHKDSVKLPSHHWKLPLYYLKIGMAIDDEGRFWEAVHRVSGCS